MHLKQNAITAMLMMHIEVFGITLDSMQFRMAKKKPSQSKHVMLNYVIIWHAWLVLHVVSRVANMRLSVPFVCLSFVSTVDNFTSNAFLPIQHTSRTSFHQSFSHSLMESLAI